jgi:hypothetical protein
MDRNVPRVGAWAGWLAVALILSYHLTLLAVAGPRVSGTDDIAAVQAYYGQTAIAPIGLLQFFALVAVLTFAASLTVSLGTSSWLRFLTAVGFGAAIAEIGIIAVITGIQAGLVFATQLGEPVGGLFRFWDAAYMSGGDALEATWVLAFGVAMSSNAAFPRYLGWLAPLTALLLALKVFAIWVGFPDQATLPSSILFAIFVASGAFGLGRLARSSTVAVSVPAPQAV